MGVSRTMCVAGAVIGTALVASATTASASPGGFWGSAGHRQSLYAYDVGHRTVVREALTGGAPKTLLSDIAASQLVVSSVGDLYVLSDRGVTKVAATTGRSTPFATDLAGPTGLATDGRGDVFIEHSAPSPQIIRIAPGGTRTVVSRVAGEFTADRAGNVSQITAVMGNTTTIVSYPASGASPTPRHVVLNTTRVEKIAAGAQGTVYVEENAGGATGFDYWVRVAAGSTTATTIGDAKSFAVPGAAPHGSFYEIRTKASCFGYHPQCAPGYSDVQRIVHYSAASGAPTSVPATGFTVLYSQHPGFLAVDGASNVYVASRDDATPRLLRYAPTGGSPQTLATGQFADLATG